MELFVDIPIFNQEQAPLEVLISMDEKDIEEKAKIFLANVDKLVNDLKSGPILEIYRWERENR